MAGGSFTWSFHHTHPASAALDKKQEEARVVTGGAGRGLMINSERSEPQVILTNRTCGFSKKVNIYDGK